MEGRWVIEFTRLRVEQGTYKFGFGGSAGLPEQKRSGGASLQFAWVGLRGGRAHLVF